MHHFMILRLFLDLKLNWIEFAQIAHISKIARKSCFRANFKRTAKRRISSQIGPTVWHTRVIVHLAIGNSMLNCVRNTNHYVLCRTIGIHFDRYCSSMAMYWLAAAIVDFQEIHLGTRHGTLHSGDFSNPVFPVKTQKSKWILRKK